MRYCLFLTWPFSNKSIYDAYCTPGRKNGRVGVPINPRQYRSSLTFRQPTFALFRTRLLRLFGKKRRFFIGETKLCRRDAVSMQMINNMVDIG